MGRRAKAAARQKWKRSETGSIGVSQGSSGHLCCAVSGSVGPVALQLVSPLPILPLIFHNFLWGSSELSKNGLRPHGLAGLREVDLGKLSGNEKGMMGRTDCRDSRELLLAG